jgi:hypothetical protein
MQFRAILMIAFLSGLFASRAAAEFPESDKLPANPALPDPRVMFDGTKVASRDDWFNKRRPELKRLFEFYMYGRLPQPLPVSAKVLHEDAKAFGGKATLREIALTLGEPAKATINLLVVVPNGAKAKAPVFVGLNFTGNHSLVNDPKILVPTSWMYPKYKGVKDNHATEAGRGTAVDVWNLESTIERGYAVATFYSGDIDPDRADKREGIRPNWPVKAEALDDTGTIMAWAWGIHRAIDYLITLPELDAKRVCCVGHSRYGKTALLAAAFDDRIALVLPLQAGCGGTAPSRGKVGEQVRQINDHFPHWFCGRFKQFNDEPAKLPFDQHCLVAICAPRPVLFANAKEDTWANPDGQFEVLRAASPVYELLSAGGLEAKERPEIGRLVDSKLGYFIRDGKHSMTREDWKVFLDFAHKQLGK